MDGFDLTKWRKGCKFTQGALATALGVSRQTVNAWEAGKGIPGDLERRLAVLDAHLSKNGPVGLPSDLPVPKWVNPMTASHLYDRLKTGYWARKPNHPLELLGEGIRDAEGFVPWAVLASDEYRAALARTQSSEKLQRRTLAPGVPTDEEFARIDPAKWSK